MESVNLLIKEGTNYTFIHRSFQEYFAAYCATCVIVDETEKMIELFAERRQDSTFLLAYEIHPGLVSKRFLFPRYTQLRDAGRLVKKRSKTDPYKCLNKSGLTIEVNFRPSNFTPSSSKHSKFRPFSFRWHWEREFEIFLFPAARVLLESVTENALEDFIFEVINKIMCAMRDEEISLPGVSSDTEINIACYYDVRKPKIAMSFSRDYGRMPNGSKAFSKDVTIILEEIGLKFEEGLTAAIRQISVHMEDLEKNAIEQRAAIEDYFVID